MADTDKHGRPQEGFSSTQGSKTGKPVFRVKDIGFFFQFIKPVWLMGAVNIALLFVISGISSLLPFTSKIFIDFIINKTGYGSIVGLLNTLGLGGHAPAVIRYLSSLDSLIIIMIVVGILFGIFNIIQAYLSSKYQQGISFNLQTALFNRVLRFPMTYLKSKQTGYLMSRVSDDVAMMQYLFSDAVTQMLSSLFYFLFGVGILTMINAELAVIIAIMIPVFFIAQHIFSVRIRALSHKEREYNSLLAMNLQETLSGIELVKSYATEKKESDRFSDKLQNVLQTRVNRTVIASLANALMSIAMFGLLIVVIFLGAQAIQSGNMTIGDYITTISYIMFMAGAVGTLYRLYLTFQPAYASMDRLKEMFGIDPEFEAEGKGKPMKKLDRVKGDIRFDNVSFAYNVNEPIISGISFGVKPGEALALVGHSGAGKTTIVNLILKLYAPQSGTIYLDGIDLKELDYQWLRQQISIVSQDVFLFNDTIENNIMYGRPGVSREVVINIAKKAHIHDFIEKLPNGYNTMVGERGAKLSAGQRQRISIARAFLKDTPILILDEPTSSIDPETEHYLKDSLDELMKGRTAIIISHRMSITGIANHVIAIDKGKIAQDGTQRDLDNEEGIYRTLRSFDKSRDVA